MNKLQKLQMDKNIKRMRSAAVQSKTALETAITKMSDSKEFNQEDLKTMETVKRFVLDMDKFLGILNEQTKN